MPWVELFAVLVVSHAVGDFLVQTEWQATHKLGGLGRDPVARRALVAHVLTYTLAFVPALIWVGVELGALSALGTAALIALPHLVQDDGRLLIAYARRVKRIDGRLASPLMIAVDQSFHLVALLLIALLVGS